MTAQGTAYNVTATGAVFALPCTFRGASIRDTSGATNTIRIYDNASAASGTILLTVQLAAKRLNPAAVYCGRLEGRQRAVSVRYRCCRGLGVGGMRWPR
jgi:hypothetical protein